MATQLADILFILIATAIAVSQAFILHSTARGMRYAAEHTEAGRKENTRGSRVALEWAYAIVPAVALLVLLLFTWRTMHPPVVQVQGVASAAARTP